MVTKALVLVSGGLDSTTCLAIAKAEGYEIHALSFDYGQLHRAELNAAKAIAIHFGAISHHIFCIPIYQLGTSALIDQNIPVPDSSGSKDIPITYVPARNTIFFSIALGYAEVLGVSKIISGISSVDYSYYPDCRPEYVSALQKVVNLATKKTVTGGEIEIVTPLIHLSKAKTIQKGLTLGVPYNMTVSCYRADDNGLACGTCDSCTFRKKGFTEAGVKDPTRYK